MNTVHTQPIIRRGGAHALMLVAVGALGLSLGRWVVPDSAPAIVTRTAEYSSGVDSPGIIGLKFAQMDARDAGHPVALAASVERRLTANVVGLKFAQMDAQDSRGGPSAAADSTAPSGDRIIELKFAQMDAED